MYNLLFLSTSNITVVVLKNNVCSSKNNTDLQRFKKILSARQRAATLLNSPAGDVPQLRRKPRKNLNKSLFKTCNRKVSNTAIQLYSNTHIQHHVQHYFTSAHNTPDQKYFIRYVCTASTLRVYTEKVETEYM